MQHGKHVYCEKPLTRTVWEARLLADAAVKYKVATQMGNQGFNHEGTKTACEILWSGDIGEVREVHSWTGGDLRRPAQHSRLPGRQTQPVPATLDWDLWLGPAATAPVQPGDDQPVARASSISPPAARWATGWSTISARRTWRCNSTRLLRSAWNASPWKGRTSGFGRCARTSCYEFPARGNMPPVTIHAYQNMRGDFKNPEGMAENERLFPPMNNLAEKGRPFSAAATA